MQTRRRFLALGAGAASAFAARPAFAQQSPFGQPPFARQLLIGVCVPLTGPQAPLGQQIVGGAQQAVDEANRMIGQLDRSFGLRPFDDGDAFPTAIMSAQFASDDPNIIATVGHLSGAVTLAALPQYANARMPLIVPASSADVLTSRGYRNVFRLPTKDSSEGQLFAHYIAGLKKYKRAICITVEGEYGDDVARSFASQASNEKLPADIIRMKSATLQLPETVKRVLAAAPDYIFLAGNTPDIGPLVPALRSAGYAGDFGACQGFYNSATIQTYSRDLGNALISTSMPPVDRMPLNNEYLSDLRARVGEVTPLSAFGFAAAQLAMNASRRTGALDRLSMLRTLSTGGLFQTLVGSFTFTMTGDPADPNLYFYSIAGGQFKFAGAAHPGSFSL
ncbi:MAG: branched chain amino acid ABC transporter substrate-binding protein LivJ [Vulcanimicrobiaceae bacterium]